LPWLSSSTTSSQQSMMGAKLLGGSHSFGCPQPEAARHAESKLFEAEQIASLNGLRSIGDQGNTIIKKSK